MTGDFLSIIVPTSSGRIPWSLIHSIKEQSLDSNSFEVLLVFNRKPRPANTVPMDNVYFYFCPFAGVNHARNLGIAHARGNVLLFLDDDCRLQDANYLVSLLALHAQYPGQMSIGGPYCLHSRATLAARAYHHNRNEWLNTQATEPRYSRALLGGNASYKAQVFGGSLRFPPGIVYGGSETPLNARIADEYGPHMFLEDLAVEHGSKLSTWAFLKKAYLQGKGSAFQKKFHSLFNTESDSADNKPSWGIALLLWLYDFCFMVGYRTSIYERRWAAASIAEEFSRRLWSYIAPFVDDLRAVSTTAFSEAAGAPLSPNLAAAGSMVYSVSEAQPLFRQLQTLPKRELERSAFTIHRRVSPDHVYRDFERIDAFYGQTPENFPFVAHARTETDFIVHKIDRNLIVFDPELSENHKIWGRDRIESSRIKNSIYYFFTDRKQFAKVLWPHRPGKTFFPLDGVCIGEDLWNAYNSQTPDPFNHFSWDQFVHTHGLEPQRDTVRVGSANELATLASHARSHFANHPSRSFYKDNVVLLGSNVHRRSAYLRGGLGWKKLFNLVPEDVFRFFRDKTVGLFRRWSHWQLEAQETSSLAYKWTAFVLHKIYWSVHKLFWLVYWAGHQVYGYLRRVKQVYWFFYKMYWVLYQMGWAVYQLGWGIYQIGWIVYGWLSTAILGLKYVYWFLYHQFWSVFMVFNHWFWVAYYRAANFVGVHLAWRTYDALMYLYMVFNSSYWYVHSRAIGPTLGFFRSLFEEPAHIRYLPLKERYKQRSLLFAKKWAWLALRGVRLR